MHVPMDRLRLLNRVEKVFLGLTLAVNGYLSKEKSNSELQTSHQLSVSLTRTSLTDQMQNFRSGVQTFQYHELVVSNNYKNSIA